MVNEKAEPEGLRARIRSEIISAPLPRRVLAGRVDDILVEFGVETFIGSVPELIAVLGGVNASSLFFNVSRQMITQWQTRNAIAAKYFVSHQTLLWDARRIRAPATLWSQVESVTDGEAPPAAPPEDVEERVAQ